jgi:hypothetical protein
MKKHNCVKAKIERNKQLTRLMYRLNHPENFFRLDKRTEFQYFEKCRLLHAKTRALSWRNHKYIMDELEKRAS